MFIFLFSVEVKGVAGEVRSASGDPKFIRVFQVASQLLVLVLPQAQRFQSF